VEKKLMLRRQTSSHCRQYWDYMHTFVALMILGVSTGTFAESLDVDTLLERLVETYGGEANVHKLDSQVQLWDVVALTSKRHGTDVRALEAPDRLRVQLTYPDKREVRIINGNASFASYRGEPEAVVGRPQSDAMRLQLMRLYSPLVLRDKRDALSLEVEDGNYVLTLFEHGVRMDYVVNSNTWRIEKVVGGLAINGQEFRFVTEYSDFAVRDGVLVHQRENKFAGGTNTAILKLRQIMLGKKISDGHFSPNYADPSREDQAL
jgi:hypothetical protein